MNLRLYQHKRDFPPNTRAPVTQRRPKRVLEDNRDTGGLPIQSPLQRYAQGNGYVMQLASLNGIHLDENIRYPNPNQAAILTHMAGEWGGGSNGAVIGGHLYQGMVDHWGPAVANSGAPNAQSTPGVHFAAALPGNNILAHQHTFRLVQAHQGGNRVSAAKASTFWPRNWINASLVGMMNSSYRCGGNTEWGSKANMSYWYRWQTLGNNTLFPIGKAPITGSQRSRMRDNRP